MKTLLVGIGSFGLGWYRTLKAHRPAIEVAVVDRNPEAARLVDPHDRFYTEIAPALDQEQPDFIVNLTPPSAHTRINHLAFDRRIPVLCEKPIAEDFREAVEIVSRAEQEGIPFMIAENYRRMLAFRKARQWIESGGLGTLSAVYVQFSKEAYFEKEYLVNMPQPLLVDVTIHHLDLFRYLTGQEGRRLFARSFRPHGSRYPGCAAVDILLETDGGLACTYSGSLSSKGAETGWAGVWRLEGTHGVLQATEAGLTWTNNGDSLTMTDFSDIPAVGCLEEFMTALQAGRAPESSGSDYLKTQRLVYAAQESIRLGQWVDVGSLL